MTQGISERRKKLLVVKLADFGDALLMTPALSALREAHPSAQIDVMTTPAGAQVFRHVGELVDNVIVFDSGPFVRRIPRLSDIMAAVRLMQKVRAQHYDEQLLMHSLVTRRGALKHAALTLAAGAVVRAGLAAPGTWRAWFLTRRVDDRGYDESHVAASMLAVAGVAASESVARPAVFEPGEDARKRAAGVLDALDAGDRPVVAIHPGSGIYSPARRWPAERFSRLADRLADAGMMPVLIGTPMDGTASIAAACERSIADLGGKTDLSTLGALLERVAAYVGNDSGVSHLAVTMGAPSVIIFGPSNEVGWGPWSPRSRTKVVSIGVPCRPCVYVGHRLGDPRGCDTRDCLMWIEVERVAAAVRNVAGAKNEWTIEPNAT